MRRFFALFALLLAFVPVLHAKQLTLRGYATAVHSPASFELDEY